MVKIVVRIVTKIVRLVNRIVLIVTRMVQKVSIIVRPAMRMLRMGSLRWSQRETAWI